MQKCENCNEAFSWKKIMLSLLMSYRDITCPNCGKVHVVKFNTRIYVASGPFVAIMVAAISKPLPGSRLTWFLVSYFAILVPSLLVCPFIAKYKMLKYS